MSGARFLGASLRRHLTNCPRRLSLRTQSLVNAAEFPTRSRYRLVDCQVHRWGYADLVGIRADANAIHGRNIVKVPSSVFHTGVGVSGSPTADSTDWREKLAVGLWATVDIVVSGTARLTPGEVNLRIVGYRTEVSRTSRNGMRRRANGECVDAGNTVVRYTSQRDRIYAGVQMRLENGVLVVTIKTTCDGEPFVVGKVYAVDDE